MQIKLKKQRHKLKTKKSQQISFIWLSFLRALKINWYLLKILSYFYLFLLKPLWPTYDPLITLDLLTKCSIHSAVSKMIDRILSSKQNLEYLSLVWERCEVRGGQPSDLFHNSIFQVFCSWHLIFTNKSQGECCIRTNFKLHT